jgi:hypothetical protein
MDDNERVMRILDQLEAGEIDADEATRRIDADPQEATAGVDGGLGWRQFWLVPLGVGTGLTALGGYLASLSGWWWLCAAPLLLVGIMGMTVAATTARSPWIHLRVRTGESEWPRRIAISLPVPVRFTAWLLDRFGGRMTGLDRTGVDELLLALEAGTALDAPIQVEVDRGDGGERIEVYFG